MLGSIEKGEDPIAIKRAERAVRTFKDVAAEFIAIYVSGKRKPRTREGYSTLLNRHINPVFGSMRMSELRRSHISKMHNQNGLDARGRQPRGVAGCGELELGRTKGRGRVRRESAKGIVRNPEAAKDRFLSSDEFKRLGEALARAETEGLPFEVNEKGPNAKHAPKPENRRRLIDPYPAAAIRLLILTGARLREILHARWENVDFERGILFLPDSKTGRKPVYLGSAALLILANLPRSQR